LGALDLSSPSYDGICNPNPEISFRPSIDYRADGKSISMQTCVSLTNFVYGDRIINFFERFFGNSVLYFNHIWFRAKGTGNSKATPPHYDSLYMGRGTQKVLTAWIPYVDITPDMGGIMLLEGSHRMDSVLEAYGTRDVDEYFPDAEDAPLIESGKKIWQKSGEYSMDAIATQADLGARWLTTDFKMGDLLIFGLFTMHASCDNQTTNMRISSDTRYQPASEPTDDRWIGLHPIGHGLKAKRRIKKSSDIPK